MQGKGFQSESQRPSEGTWHDTFRTALAISISNPKNFQNIVRTTVNVASDAEWHTEGLTPEIWKFEKDSRILGAHVPFSRANQNGLEVTMKRIDFAKQFWAK